MGSTPAGGEVRVEDDGGDQHQPEANAPVGDRPVQHQRHRGEHHEPVGQEQHPAGPPCGERGAAPGDSA